MDRFTLLIELGGAAMQTPKDVAEALRELAEYLDGVGHYEQGEDVGWHLDAGTFMDVNGNTVGEWDVDTVGE